MHPIDQIWNFNSSREYQGRGTEHVQAPLHVEDAPILMKTTVIAFIDHYVTYSVQTKKRYSELYNLVKTVQSHSHTQICKKGSYHQKI